MNPDAICQECNRNVQICKCAQITIDTNVDLSPDYDMEIKKLRTRVAELEAELEQAKRSEKVYRALWAASVLILNDMQRVLPALPEE